MFSVVVMAHLKSIEVKDGNQRKQWKMNLVRNLYQRGWDRTIIIDLLRFIDWVIALPKDLAEEFSSELQQFEKEQQMQYVTSFERIGVEKGKLEEGVAILRRLMTKKFGEVPKDAEERIEKADSDTLLEWSENVLSAETIDEVFH